MKRPIVFLSFVFLVGYLSSCNTEPEPGSTTTLPGGTTSSTSSTTTTTTTLPAGTVVFLSALGSDSDDGMSPSTAKATFAAALDLAKASNLHWIHVNGDFIFRTAYPMPAGS